MAHLNYGDEEKSKKKSVHLLLNDVEKGKSIYIAFFVIFRNSPLRDNQNVVTSVVEYFIYKPLSFLISVFFFFLPFL